MSTRGLRTRLGLGFAALPAVWAGALPTPLAVAALAFTFLFAPGWLAARALLPARLEDRLAAAIALSPLLSGAPLALAVWAGVPLPLAARGVALLVGALALLPPPGERAVLDARGRAALLAAGAWTLAVAVPLLANRWLASRSDGWFHAAVTLQVLQRGVPPEDPYFAGLSLLYFWGAHVWAAAWLALAPRLSVYAPLVAFNLGAALAVVLALGALARRFGAGPRTVALTAALAVLGYSPFCWLLPAERATLGHAPGWGTLAALVGNGLDGALDAMAFGQLHGSMVFFGDKFVVLTQFSLGLALAVLALALLLDVDAEPRPRAAVALALVLASALFVHTLVGYALLLAILIALAVRLPAAVRGDARARRTLLLLVPAAAGALLLLAPYLAEITLGKQGQVRLAFDPRSAVSLVFGGALYVVPGIAWAIAHARPARGALPTLAIVLVLLVLAVTLKLPENNRSKFLNLAFVMLAAPAALGWGALWRRLHGAGRTVLAGALLAAVLPTQLALAAALASEHGQSGQAWPAPAPGVREAMAWARAHTPADAAFCDLGGGRELLSLAGRSVLWGGESGERDFGYAPAALAARRDLVGALCRGREPGPAGARLLAGLTRDVIVMTRGAADARARAGALAARPERFELLWRNADVAFWRVRVR